MNKLKFFPSVNARKIFFTLFFSFIIILLAALFVSNAIWQLTHSRVDPNHKIHQILQIYNRAKLSLSDKKPRLIKVNDKQNIRARIANHPVKAAQQFLQPSSIQIIQWFKAHPQSRKVALKLNENKWLNLVIMPPRQHIWRAAAGFILLAIILLIIVILLCGWAVRRLAPPLADLAAAAKRLGIEINMPPLAATNNRELNDIINAFNQVQIRIRKLINDRTQMLAAISHDLRTPITRLKLRAESFSGTPEYQKIIADLEEMEAMITAVLQFARFDAGDEILERFDLNALLESLCNDLADTGMEVHYQSELQRLPFFGCLNALKRAFVNLINNAVKYGECAKVTLKQKESAAVIEIEDRGAGIPEEALAKVFAPFYRVDKSRSRKTGGTGLGLTIARDTIVAHNGDITLMNLSAGGLRATIILPLEPEK